MTRQITLVFLFTFWLSVCFRFLVTGIIMESAPYTTVNDCENNEIFNAQLFKCEKCDETRNLTPFSNKLECVCNRFSRKPWSTQNQNIATLKCETCPNGTIPTSDKLDCIPCRNYETIRDVLICRDCPTTSVFVERLENGSLATDDGHCVRCTNNTIPSNGNKCVPCPITYAQSNCTCANDRHLVHDVCVHDSDLIDWPDTVESYVIEVVRGTKFESHVLKTYLRWAVFLCKMKNETACQLVANLCSLVLFQDYPSSPCRLFRDQQNSMSHLPWLFYNGRDANIIIYQKKIDSVYTINKHLETSYVNITTLVYDFDGHLKDVRHLNVYDLDLCPDAKQMRLKHLQFGVNFEHTCNVFAQAMFTSEHGGEFFVPYLSYIEKNRRFLHAIPIFVRNSNNGNLNLEEDSTNSGIILVRRYFLIDNILTKQFDAPTTARPKLIQYAKSIDLKINVRSKSDTGKIYPPYFTIEYGYVLEDDVVKNVKIPFRFSVTFQMENKSSHLIEIYLTIICCLGALYAGIQTWSYARRSGHGSIDLRALLRFAIFLCGNLSSMFFLVAACISIHTLVFFKGQSVVYVLLPDDKTEALVCDFIIMAAVLKMIDIAALVQQQINIDIFLIDWERSRLINSSMTSSAATLPVNSTPTKSLGPGQQVSIWRTYFIANEWVELQTVRKINVTVHGIVVGCLLEVFGLKYWANSEFELNRHWMSPLNNCRNLSLNIVLQVALGIVCFLITYAIHVAISHGLYERFVKDQMQQFVDVCSMANISVFILKFKRYGYYLHGRSVHGFADTDMTTMITQLQREENNLCGRRGLIPETDEQTFSMFIPASLRVYFTKLLAPIVSSSDASNNVKLQSNKLITENDNKMILAYDNVNKFLSAFFQHALKDLDFEVKDKQFAESLLDIEFSETFERAVLYRDNGHSFDQVLFYGNEMKLVTFDLMLFSCVVILTGNFLCAIFSVIIVFQIMSFICKHAGRKNLAKKTLIDKRFLM